MQQDMHTVFSNLKYVKSSDSTVTTDSASAKLTGGTSESGAWFDAVCLGAQRNSEDITSFRNGLLQADSAMLQLRDLMMALAYIHTENAFPASGDSYGSNGTGYKWLNGTLESPAGGIPDNPENGHYLVSAILDQFPLGISTELNVRGSPNPPALQLNVQSKEAKDNAVAKAAAKAEAEEAVAKAEEAVAKAEEEHDELTTGGKIVRAANIAASVAAAAAFTAIKKLSSTKKAKEAEEEAAKEAAKEAEKAEEAAGPLFTVTETHAPECTRICVVALIQEIWKTYRRCRTNLARHKRPVPPPSPTTVLSDAYRQRFLRLVRLRLENQNAQERFDTFISRRKRQDNDSEIDEILMWFRMQAGTAPQIDPFFLTA